MIDVAAKVLRDVPGTTLAQDSAGRATDIAIDHSEFARLTLDQIEAVVEKRLKERDKFWKAEIEKLKSESPE